MKYPTDSVGHVSAKRPVKQSTHPSLKDKARLANKIRDLAESNQSDIVNQVFQKLWTHHCHPSDNDPTSFASKHTNVINRYRFDLEAVSDDLFWEISSSLGL